MPRHKRKISEPTPHVSKMKKSISLIQCPAKPDDQVNNDSNPMDSSQLSQLSQVELFDTSHNGVLCIKCSTNVSTDALHVTSLKCCICENHYHGTCMDIDNPTLLSFLHVVADIGGWACVGCRKRGGKAPAKAAKKQENISDDLAQIKSHLVSISDALKQATINPGEGTQSVWKFPSSDIFKPPSSSHPISSPPTLDTNVRTALLSAVHTEFQSISNRALNVVVTGIKPSTIADRCCSVF